MSDQQNTKPSFNAFNVKAGKDGKNYFNRIGTAFPHRDGQGHNIVLDSYPVNGVVTLRSPQERMEQAQANAQGQGQTQGQGQQQTPPDYGYER